MAQALASPPLYDADGRPLGRGGLAFTDEQSVAVLQREGPMLLSANAGSGKTAVLAERFVRAVVEDGCRPGELLAITFTEKAAGELRGRIRTRFMELGEREAARDMDGAWISTIHGFCARVLRSHAVTAGLDPAFVVLDEATARQARTEAFTTALAAFMAPPSGTASPPAAELELVATWGVDRLHDAIATVHDELRSTGHTVPRLPPVPPLDPPAAQAARLRAAFAAVDAERATWRTGLVSLDAAQVALDVIGAALDAAATGGSGAASTADPALASRLRGLKLAKQAKELKTDACAELRGALAAVLQGEVDAEAVVVHRHLDRVLGLYAEAYSGAKRGRSAVDYDDLELLTNDLLRRAPAVAGAYRERFARIMVDEFQDTNPLQLQLLSHLDAGNVFLVGDALQSIYGFRHADVGVFRAQRRRHEALGVAPALATNWRSRPGLLSTINAAFGGLHEDYVPLVAARESDGDGPLVELLLIDDAHDDPERLAAPAAAALQAGMPQARNLTLLAEARAVAARVRALINGDDVAAGEVAVLLRAASDLHVFERALELEGLATLASGGRGFWLRQQVQDLTSYLAALANPMDEPALLGLLASPLVGVSSDALAAIAQAGREQGRGPWALVTHGAEGIGLPPADRAAVTAFAAWFAAERAQAPLLALDQLITRVVQRTGYDLHVLGLSGGRRRLANIHKLERLAAEFELRAGRDVRAFIDHVAAEVDAQAREPDAPVELGDLDAVQLMTIHAAKGLEFGVVVVAGLGRQGQAGVNPILVAGDRVGLRLPRLHAVNADALDYAELKQRAQQAQIEEERRIMHVAFTRAEERLIISGAVTPGKTPPAERAGGAPLTWVGVRIDPLLQERLTPDDPAAAVDRQVGADRLAVAVRLVSPDVVGDPGATADDPAPDPDPDAADAGRDLTEHEQADADAQVPAARERAGLATGGAGDAGDVQLSLTHVEPTAPPAHRSRRTAAGRKAVPAASAAAAVSTPPAPPATLSYSSLSDHAGCGYRYYLRRVLGLPRQEPPPLPAVDGPDGPVVPVPPAGIDPLLRGSLAHALLEGPDPAAATADDVRELASEHDVELTDEEVADLLRLAGAFGSTALGRRVAGATTVRREDGFAFALDDADPGSPLVNGFIDLVAVLADGSWLIVDYKTNRVDDADLTAIVEGDYATQRRIYALAALRAGAPSVEVAYVFLQRADEPVSTTYDAADAPVLTGELITQAAPLLDGVFAVSERPHRDLCAYCPGRGGMCSWPEAMSLRPAPSA
ncbi:DNA helicase [Paraconexibacter sp. AEG42_29]|uniref:DNA 3'-5' helicase n=1 Tax=Paraconexibacter sp. AEG42_29 TaxID=2997339 RepID=A0AAU7AZF2_9ACTN